MGKPLHLLRKNVLAILAIGALTFTFQNQVQAQGCAPDVTPPVHTWGMNSGTGYTFVVNDSIVSLTADGTSGTNANLTAALAGTQPTFTDNCTPAANLNVSSVVTGPTTNACGADQWVRTWQAVDDNSNTLTITQIFTEMPVVTTTNSFTCESTAAFSLDALPHATVTGGSGASTITYSGPGVAASPTFDPGAAGVGTHTLTASATDASGCTSIATFEIEVREGGVPTITGPTEVCNGSSIDLDVAVAGGNAPYTLAAVQSGGTGTAIVTTNTGAPVAGANVGAVTVTGTGVGTVDVNVTITDADGCEAVRTHTITVNEAPVPTVTGDIEGCLNADVDWAVAVAGGTGPYTLGAVQNGGTGTATVAVNTGMPAAGPNAAAITITGTAPGTVDVDVTLTDDNGCATTVTRTITINPLPTAGPITGPTEVCNDATITLNGNPAGGSGTFAGGSSAHLWTSTAVAGVDVVITNNNDGTADIEGDNTTASTQTITIEYTPTDDRGCQAAAAVTYNVDVHPNPTITVTPDPASVCLNEDIDLGVEIANGAGAMTLTAVQNGGTGTGTIAVNTPAPVNGANAAAVTVTGTAVGTVTVDITVTDANGCSTLTSHTVTVNELPTATVDPVADFCLISNHTGPVFGFVTLNAIPADGATPYTHAWTQTGGTGTGAFTDAAVEDAVFTAATAGTITLEYVVTDNNGCMSVPVTVSFEVFDNPTANVASIPGEVCEGANATLTAAATGGSGTYTTYTWSVVNAVNSSGSSIAGTSATPTFTAGDVTAGASGTVGVVYTVTDDNGCVSATSPPLTVTINDNPENNPTPATVTICEGTSTIIDGMPTGGSGVPANYTHNWVDLGTGTFTGTVTLTPIANNVTVGTSSAAGVQGGTINLGYTVTDATTGCTSIQGTATVTVNDNPELEILATSADEICIGGSGNINGNLTAGTVTGGTHTWTVVGGTEPGGNVVLVNNNDGTATLTVSGAATAGNTVIVEYNFTDADGCAAVAPVQHTVTINDELDAAPTPTAGCEGSMIVVSGNPSGGSGTYTHTWVYNTSSAGIAMGDVNITNNNNGTATIVVNPTTDLTAVGTVTLDYTVSEAGAGVFGCPDVTESVVITINPLPSANPGPDPSAVCEEATINLDGNPTDNGGSGIASHNWAFVSSSGVIVGGDVTIATPAAQTTDVTVDVAVNITAIETMTLSYTVTDNNGCSRTELHPVIVRPLPTAVIAATPNEVCLNQMITLDGSGSTAVAPATVASYDWQVTAGPGNGTFADNTLAMPVFTGTVAGAVTIELTITDSNGCTDTETHTVTVHPLPTADIIPDAPSVCGDGSMQVLDGQGASASGPLTHAWSITAGGTLGSIAPTNAATTTFTSASTTVGGTVTVSYTVTDANGCSTTVTEDITVLPRPVAAIAATPNIVCEGASITLDGTASGGSGAGYTYAWTVASTTGTAAGNFTDNTAEDPQFNATGGPGTATVELVVTDGDGCTSVAASHTITINDQPTANITPNPAAVCENSSITLDGNPSGGSGTYPVLGHVWTAVNASGTAAGVITNNGDGTILLSVTGNGTLDVSYTVTDDQGCTSVTVNRTVTVNAAPTAGPIIGGTEVCVGEDLNLNGQPTGGSGTFTPVPPANHDWQITGGTGTANITNNDDGTIVLTGVSAGTVELAYTPTDDLGCVAAAPVTLTVTVNANPTANITGTNELCGDGTSTTLLDGNGAAVAPAAIATHAWSITSGGGTLITMVGAGNAATETFQSVNTTVGGTATVQYIVTDDNGCSTTVTYDITVHPRPTVSITPTAAVCEGTTVTFSGNPTGGSGTYTSHNWVIAGTSTATANLGGGASGNGDGTIDITITGDGNLDLEYTVTDNEGCVSETATQTIVVNDQPTATIAAAPNEVCLNETITIDATPAGGDGTYTHAWTVTPGTGNGTLADATVEDPVFTGTASENSTTGGTVTLTYVATDGNGCTSVPVDHVVTVNPLPTPTVTATNSNSVCIGNSIDLDVNVADGIGPYTLAAVVGAGGTGAIGGGGSVVVNTPAPAVGANVSAITINTTAAATAGTVNIDVTLTDVNNCDVTETFTIVVNDLPTAGPITPDPANVCEGESITLDGNPAGGSGAYVDHNWEIIGGTGTATINGAATSIAGGTGTVGNGDGTAVLNATAAGTIDVRYQVEDNNGCISTFSATLSVTVEDLPTITLGANPEVCQGTTTGNLVYTATTNAPDQYTIDFDLAAEAEGFVDVTTPTALPASPITITIPATAAVGTYNATITVINSTTGCSSTPANAFTVTINENPVINITGDTSLCAGGLADQTTVLTAATISGTPDANGYVWTSLDPAIATVGGSATNMETITGVSAGSVIITVRNTDANGCISNLDSQVVVVNPLPDNSIVVGDVPAGCVPPNSNSNVTATVFNAQANTRYEVTINGMLYTTSNTGTTPTNILFTLSSADVIADAGSSPFTVTAVNITTGCSQNLVDDLVVGPPNQTPPVPVLTPDDIEICEQEQVTIFATDYSQPGFGYTTVIYDWSASDPGHGIADTVALNNNQITALPADTGVYTYRLTVIADGCPSQEAQVNITVHDLPIVFPQAFDIVCGDPDSLLLTANVQTLKIPAQFQWTGPGGFSSVNPTEVIHSPTVAQHQGTYTLMVTDSVGCTTDGSVTVQITEDISQPVISATSSTVCMNEVVTLNATTYSNPDISTVQYEWSVNGTVLTTTTSPSLTAVAGSASLPAGNYTVRAIVTYGNTTPPTVCDKESGTFVLTVEDAPSAVVAVTDADLCEGENLVITVDVSGSPSTIIQYTWTGPNGFTLTSTTTGDLTINNITAAQSGTYSLAIRTSAGCETVYSETITVTPRPSQPTISANDADLTICSGTDVVLTAPIYTGTTVSYAWTATSGTVPTTTTSNTITVAPTVTTTYSLIVTVNDCPSAQSDITLVVADNPVLVVNDLTVDCADGTNDLDLGGAIDGTSTGIAGATHNWTGPNGFSATGTNPTINNVSSANNGIYTLTVTTGDGCSDTESFTVTVTDAVPPVTVTVTDATPCTGDQITLSATDFGDPTLTYLWDADAGNATTPTVTVTAVAGLTNYEVTVTRAGTACNSVASIDVTGEDAPNITAISTASDITCLDGTTDILIDATVTGASSYSWVGPNGFFSTDQDPLIANATSANSGPYVLTATSANNGCTSTQTFTLTITDEPAAPTLTASDLDICLGEQVTLTGTNYNVGTIGSITYNWTGVGLPAQDQSNQIVVTPTVGAQTYTYSVTIDGCISETGSVTIDVEDAPLITAITTSSDTTCLNGTTDILLEVDASNPNNFSFAWNGPNGFSSTTEDPTIVNATSANSGVYTVTATSSNGCTTTLSQNIEITDQPQNPTLAISDATICLNESVILTGTNYSVGTGTNISYNWTAVPNAGLPVSNQFSTLVATPTAVGNYTYRYSVTIDGCTSTIAEVDLSVEDVPTITLAITGDTTCVDGTTDVNLEGLNTGTAATTYSWTGPNGFSANTLSATIVNATSADNGQYTLVSTSANGCQDISSANVVITDEPASPTLSVSDATICDGQSITLTGTNYAVPVSGNITYNWAVTAANAGDGGLPTALNSSTITATPSGADTYTYTYSVTIEGCQSDVTSIVVVVEDAPTIAPALDASTPAADLLCVDGTTDMILNANSTGTPVVTWAWSGPNGFSSNVADPTISNITSANSGTYTLVATSANGCMTTQSVNINITDEPANPNLTASDMTICRGETVTLTGTAYSVATNGSITYNWSVNVNGGLPGNTDASTLVAEPTAAGTYTYVYSVTIDGCQSTEASVVVVVEDAPTIAPSVTGDLTCVDGTTDMQLFANVTPPPAVVTYSWSGPAGFTSNIADPMVSNITSANSGTYTLVATSANGCTTTELIDINITDEPANPTLGVSDATICLGESVTLTGTAYNVATNGTITYNWSETVNGGLPASTQLSTLVATPTAAGTITYTYSVTIDGCQSSDATVTITVQEAPTIDPQITGDLTCVDGTTDAQLLANSTGTPVITWAWNGPNGFSSSDENPILSNITSANSGTYTLTATSANGCTTTDNVNIDITDEPVNPNLVVSDATICDGESVTLTGTSYTVSTGGSGAITYNWSVNAGGGLPTNDQASTLVATPDGGSGTYIYQYSVTIDGCTSEIALVTVTVEEAPTIAPSVNGLPTLLCVDGTTDMELLANSTSVDSVVSWSWSGPNGFSSSDENPVISNITSANSGTYTLTAVTDHGCSTTETLVINITDEPVAPTLTVSDATICLGDEITLTGTNYSVGTQGTIQYNWTGSGVGTPNPQSSTIVVQPTGLDSLTYTYSVTIDGCTSEIATVTIFVEEAPIIAPSVVGLPTLSCVDGTTDMQLFANSTGEVVVSWNWSGPAGFTSIIEDPVISNITSANSGTYSLTATSANGCSTTELLNINITDEPAAPTLTASDETICLGDEITLTGTNYSVGTGGTIQYNWAGNNIIVPGPQSSTIVVEPTSLGNLTYTYFVTIDGCDSEIASVTINVEDAPTVSIAPPTGITCVDGTTDMILDATITGTPAVTTVWSGPLGYSSNDVDALVSNITSANSGTYTLVSTSANGCQTVTTIDVNITDEPAAPTLTSSDNTICLGDEITLTGTNYGVGVGGTIQYNWAGDAITSPGQQSSTINVTPVTTGLLTYTYFVTIDGCDSEIASVIVNVEDAPIIAPSVTGDLTCVDGTTDMQLFANSTGTPVITYAWSGPVGFTSNIADPIISNITSANSGTYTLIATSANGCSTTELIDINITDQPNDPTLTASDQTICLGESVILTGTNYNVGTSSNISYNWTGDGLPGSTDASTIIITPTMTGDLVYTYDVTIDGCTSTTASITINVEDAPVVTIATPPTTQTACVDGTTDVLLDATITGTPAVTTVWSGPAGFSSNDEDAVISNVTSANSGTYTLMATSENGCVTITTIDVDITDEPADPTMTASDMAICLGESVTLTGTNYNVASNGTISYNWTGDGLPVSTSSSTIIVTPTTTGDLTYTYSVTIDGCPSATSSVTISVEDEPTVSIAAPAAAAIQCVDGTTDITLDATITGTPAETTVWSGPNGYSSNAEDAVIPNITSANSGTYTLVATSANGCETVINITINITDQPADPTLTASDQTICLGESVTLTGTNYNVGTNGSISYNWTSTPNGGLPSSTASSTIIVTPTAIGTQTYTYNVTIDGCTSTTGTVSLTVEEGPTVSIAAPSGTACVDGTTDITLDATITGIAAVTTQWSGPAGYSSNNEDAVISNVTSANSGTYTLVATSANGCVTIETIDVNITDEPAAPNLSATTLNTCAGTAVTLVGTNYSVGVTGTISYNWTSQTIGSGTAVPVANQANFLNVNPTDTTTYTYSVTIDGCTSEVATITVNVEDAPTYTVNDLSVACADGTTDATIFVTNIGGSPITSWSWTGPNGFTSSSQDATLTNVTSALNGTYTVTATTAHGCSTTQSVTVTITDEPTTPTVNADDNVICLGDNVTLTSSTYTGTTVVYSWTASPSSGSGIAAATNSNQIVLTPTAAGTYTYSIAVTVDGCVSDMSSVTVTVDPLPTVAPSYNTAAMTCTDGTVDLTLFAGGSGGTSWSWTGPNGFNSSNENPIVPDATSANAGSYTVTAISANGCMTTQTLDVIITDEPTDPTLVADDNAICLGDDVVITGTTYAGGLVNYNWTATPTVGSGIFGAINSNQITVTPTAPGTYTYTLIVDVDGCTSNAATVTVTVESVPTVAPSYNASTLLCTNGMGDLTLSAGGVGGAIWIWSGPNGFTSSAQNPVIANATSANAGTYTVTAISANGCGSVTASIVVSITDQPVAPQLISNDNVICLDDNIVLTTTNYSGNNVVYNWSSSDDANSGISNAPNSNQVVITPTASGVYTYFVDVTVDGCTSERVQVTVTVEQTITANSDLFNTVEFNSTFTGFVTANDVFDANQATTITVFSDASNGSLDLRTDGTFDYTPNSGFLGTDQFTYILCYASATNPCACDTATVTLSIDVNRIQTIDIPNVITPNEDGVNDQLVIPGIEQDLPCTLPNGCNELTIFNQWGDVVFSAENYENNWKGTYNGQPLPDATYYYVFRDKTATAGQQEYYYGFITVIR